MEKLNKRQCVHNIRRLNWGLRQLLEDENNSKPQFFFGVKHEHDMDSGIDNTHNVARNKLRLVSDTPAHSVFLDDLILVDDKPRVTLAMVKERFLKLFPNAFYDQELLRREHNYKDKPTKAEQQLFEKRSFASFDASRKSSPGYRGGVPTCYALKKLCQINSRLTLEPCTLKRDSLHLLTPAKFAGSLFDFLHGNGVLLGTLRQPRRRQIRIKTPRPERCAVVYMVH